MARGHLAAGVGCSLVVRESDGVPVLVTWTALGERLLSMSVTEVIARGA